MRDFGFCTHFRCPIYEVIIGQRSSEMKLTINNGIYPHQRKTGGGRFMQNIQIVKSQFQFLPRCSVPRVHPPPHSSRHPDWRSTKAVLMNRKYICPCGNASSVVHSSAHLRLFLRTTSSSSSSFPYYNSFLLLPLLPPALQASCLPMRKALMKSPSLGLSGLVNSPPKSRVIT